MKYIFSAIMNSIIFLMNQFSLLFAYIFTCLSQIVMTNANIPKSIAVIMDGNRRYANNLNLKKEKGHEHGLDTLLQLINWSLLLGIKEVTAYAFSIDNFNRTEEEIIFIKKLIKEKFNKLVNEKKHFEKMGVKIQIIGKLSLFEDDELVEILNKIEESTKSFGNLVLNICVAYNFTEEFEKTHKYIKLKKSEMLTDKDYIKIFEEGLYHNIKPDLLIRTSGETRLSNFLHYQTRSSMLIFSEKNWPDLSYYDFIKILLKYHINYSLHLENLKRIENF